MQIHVKAGGGARITEDETSQISGIVESSLDRYADRLTTVEVFLSDENSREKHGKLDKRCLIEARSKGFEPLAVEAHADEYLPAVKSCVEKLLHAVEHRIDRLRG
jgi:hypothetical protein